MLGALGESRCHCGKTLGKSNNGIDAQGPEAPSSQKELLPNFTGNTSWETCGAVWAQPNALVGHVGTRVIFLSYLWGQGGPGRGWVMGTGTTHTSNL